MHICCWGCRGSIPVSGKEYLKYGGDTSCFQVVTARGSTVIIDAGSGIRRLGQVLHAAEEKNIHLIFTHRHWDHILGFPFFRPIYDSRFSISVYGCPFAQQSVKQMLSGAMVAPHFPVDFSAVKATFSFYEICTEPFEIDGMKILPTWLSHPNQGLGFRFEEGGTSFVLLTDNELDYRHEGGLGFDEYAEFCAGADLLFHDAEFSDEEYRVRRSWGHSCYRRAVDLASCSGVKRLGLLHHNQDHSDDVIDQMLQHARQLVQGTSGLDVFALAQDDCFALNSEMPKP